MTAQRPVPAKPETACAILLQCYRDEAGTEALLRALIAERSSDCVGAQFWIEVYRLIAAQN